MIKLERPERPAKITDEIVKELTLKFQGNPKSNVWCDTRIHSHIREALKKMSHSKCAYCECDIDVESKDLTVEHFHAKSSNPDKVLEWTNFLPSCLRCNRRKSASPSEIIDPSEVNPTEHLCFEMLTSRILEKSNDKLGKATREVLDLNDEKVRVIRAGFCVELILRSEKIYEVIANRLKSKNTLTLTQTQINDIFGLLEDALPENHYSASLATVLLNNDYFIALKQLLESKGLWDPEFQQVYEKLECIQLKLYKAKLFKREFNTIKCDILNTSYFDR